MPVNNVAYEAVSEAANSVEMMLLDEELRASGAAELVDALIVAAPATNTDAIYQPQILARYCSAAGEAMRISVKGSEQRARTYLLTALGHAEQDFSPDLSARVAYRIALAAGQGGANPNSRSARRELRAVLVPEVDRPRPPAGMNDLCGVLFDQALGEETTWYTTQASLDCAFANSQLAANYRIGALSRLQLARNALSEAERRPLLRQSLRTQAREAAQTGLGSAAQLTDSDLRFALTARLVEAALDSGQGDSPEIRSALALLRENVTNDPEKQAMLNALDGRLFAVEGRMADASASYRRAIYFESQRIQPFRMADWYLLLAEAEPEKSRLHIGAAYRALETVRPLLPLVDPITEESTFALRMQPVFKAAIAAQLDLAILGNDAGRIRSAQQIVETFRQAEIESTFGRDCVPPRDPIEPKDLMAGEILLYPILLDDHVELLTATAGSQAYQRLKPAAHADRDRVATLVSKMAYTIAYGEDDSWEEPARELYDILIAPIEGQLAPGSTLVIIPDGVLRILPFAALRDAAGKLLVERTRIAVAPALAYAQPGTHIGKDPRVVAASLEVRVELSAGTFPALAGTSEEARVASGLGDPEQRHGLLIENFNRAELEDAFAAEPVDILHLATHATFNGRSERSFIVANDGAISLNNLRAMIEINRSRGKELSLIVLSACETAVGDDRATMGLAGTAVQAGAQSAIASLWQVDDVGTVELMRQFYTFLGQSESRAEALRHAQLALIAKGGVLADPSIWAAFSLMGGWR